MLHYMIILDYKIKSFGFELINVETHFHSNMNIVTIKGFIPLAKDSLVEEHEAKESGANRFLNSLKAGDRMLIKPAKVYFLTPKEESRDSFASNSAYLYEYGEIIIPIVELINNMIGRFIYVEISLNKYKYVDSKEKEIKKVIHNIKLLR